MVGTIPPYPNFDAEADCDSLKNAMKGLGTDEARIVEILGTRCRKQRFQIVLKYKDKYKKDLAAELKSELSANFLRLCVYLLMPISDFLAKEIKRAMKGSGTDETALVEILVGLDNNGITDLKQAYQRLYHTELERDIVGETSGEFKKLAISLLDCKRDESMEVNFELAKEDAVELFDAGINRFGTDESKFNKILVSRSYNHLKAVFAEYRALANEDIENSVRAEMTGELELGFLSIVKKIKNTPTYFAEELYKSMKGLGTDDDRLIRIVVWRSEIDMQEIKGAFKSLYAKSLASYIKEDTSGDYEKLLLTIVKP